MPSSMPVWSLSLSRPPRIHNMAVSVHGASPVDVYRNLNFWSLHAYSYSAQLRIDRCLLEIRPGMVSILPPGRELEFRYRGRSRHIYAHFDLQTPLQGQALMLPAMLDLRERFRQFDASFLDAVSWFPNQPERAQARLWDLLWQLSAIPASQQALRTGNRVVDRSCEIMELRLGEPLSVARVAEELEISHTHLVRLFRQFLGVTPLAYVHRRRAEQARHLLLNTTLPMKSIARQIGLQDPQQFNKLMRRTLGCAPSEVRRSTQTETR